MAEAAGLDLEEQERQAAQPSQGRLILEWNRPSATRSNALGKLGLRGAPPFSVAGPVPMSHSWVGGSC